MALTMTRLPLETAAITGFTHKVNALYSDLTASTAIQIFPETVGKYLSPGTIVDKVAVQVVTAFDSATSSSISIGDVASASQYFSGFDVKTTPGTTGYKLAAASTNKVYTSATEYLTVTRIETGAATVGELNIFLRLSDVDAMARA